MHRAANASRFLIGLSSEREFADWGIAFSHNKLLQHTVLSQLAHAANSRQFINELCHRLIRFAEHALSLRDMCALDEASLVLMNLHIAWARQIGQYYQALVINRNGQKHEALSLLETVADEAPLCYRARAIQSLGGVHHELGHPDEALRLYAEATRAASHQNGGDLLTTLLVGLGTSCIKSEMGDHRGALAGYEKLAPLVQFVARQNPLYFYFYQNDLAVEFAEFGRVAEAEAACAIALASPFAPAYPEWSETRDEIAAKRVSATPSIVAVNREIDLVSTPQPKPVAKSQRILRRAILWSVLKSALFQRPSKPLAATVAIARDQLSHGILDRIFESIEPRAPPSFS